MDTTAIRITTRICAKALVVCVGIYVLSYNFPLFGLNHKANNNDITALLPNSRVKKENVLGTEIERQTDDLTYFTTKSEGFDSATVKFEFMSTSADQALYLGFKDSSTNHYNTKPVNLPFLNNLDWRRITFTMPFIYAKNDRNYSSEEDFLRNPPRDPVGIYFVDPSKYETSIDMIADYSPSQKHMIIDTPLRGSHTFYVFLGFQPFEMSITKQDLNNYEGEDNVYIKVFKGTVMLTDRLIKDDGNTTSSGPMGNQETADISYEGGNPENGVYKIVIEANADTIIKKISTNLSRIVFEPPLFILSKNWNDASNLTFSPVTLYTDARKLSFRTYHTESLQEIKIGSDTVDLSGVEEEKTYENNKNYNMITIPKGDVVVEGQGYFAFTKDQYFSPFIFKKIDIRKKEDLEKVDYFVTDYLKPFNTTGNWKLAEVEFDLKDAYYSNGKLSWIIKAPGLKANGQELYIRNMEVMFHKKAIIK